MTEEPYAPRPSGADPMPTEVEGKFFPWGSGTVGRPVFLTMPMSDDLYLPLFSTEDELRTFLGDQGVVFASVKKIDHPKEFLASIYAQPRLKVIMNLRVGEDGRILFTELAFAPDPDAN